MQIQNMPVLFKFERNIMKTIPVLQFVEAYPNAPVIDTRSPGEYLKGHIPGAVNIPLFENEERTEIGITYKLQGKETAVKEGLKIVGPKMATLIEDLEKITHSKSTTVKIYCWRGGMRSSSMAWLFETAGYECVVLEYGYKSYRNLMTRLFDRFQIILLGGETGAGKTKVLQELYKAGEQVVDLEKLANHKGSAFGAIGEAEQPTYEHFQNLVIEAFLKLNQEKRVFLEDESSHIGKVGLPENLWRKMKSSPVVCISVKLQDRIGNLVADYGHYDKSELESGILKIGKKLGGQHEKSAIANLQNGDLGAVAGILLHYYDKTYRFLLEKKRINIILTIEIGVPDPKRIAAVILHKLKSAESNLDITTPMMKEQ